MKHKRIAKICNRFRMELRSLLIMLGISRSTTVCLISLGVLIFLDWYIRYRFAGRLISLIIFVLTMLFLFLRQIIRPMKKRWSDSEVLAYIDVVDPKSQDSLTCLHELVENPDAVGESVTPEGRAIMEHTITQLESDIDTLKPGNTFQRKKVRRWQMTAAVVLVAAILIALPYHTTVLIGLKRMFLPFAKIRWTQLTTLIVAEPENGWVIPQGEPFTVKTEVQGQKPIEIQLIYKSDSTDYWITEHVSVDAKSIATYKFEEVAEPVTFYLKGGDDETGTYNIGIIERPRISQITSFYTYPVYAKLPPRKINSGQLRGLEGTKVKIEFQTSVPVEKAIFHLKGKEEETLQLLTETSFSKELLLTEDGSYQIKLFDKHGFREYRPERYDIQVIPDNPPEVRILSPGKDVIATTKASLNFIIEAKDDFGLTEVRFMHAIGSGATPNPLTDHITGPIKQRGKKSRAEFVWDFSKIEVKNNVDVEYYLFARDCNPTGRGKSETDRYKVSLLPPTQFQLQVLYEARRIVNETRVAYKNQKKTYYNGMEWVKEFSSGKIDDEKWSDILGSQALTSRATNAIGFWLKELNGHIEINRMENDFMKPRLEVIESLWNRATQQIKPVQSELEKSHPTNAAEASPDRLKSTRIKALKKVTGNQKTAVIALGKLLRKMYDWENLQTALVNSRLLRERMGEIYSITRQIAPKTIGKEIEDLEDDMVDRILTLGQQQRATFETETSLEQELGQIALKADKEGRTTVKRYLLVAFKFLKDRRINDKLKIIVERINNNQLSDVAKDQTTVIQAMRVVEGGLVKAGKDTTEEAINIAELLKKEADVEQVTTIAAEDDEDDTLLSGEEFERRIEALVGEVTQMGKDALSQSLLSFAEQQDSIKSRTNYLSKTLKPEDMPRFKRLKMGLLRHKQDSQNQFAELKIDPLIEKSEHKTILKPLFKVVQGQIRDIAMLLKDSDIQGNTRSLQEDVIESSRDIAQFIARQKQITDTVDDHIKRGGKDDFDREYLMRGEDLKRAGELFGEMNIFLTEQSSLTRKSEWMKSLKGDDRKIAKILDNIYTKIQKETAEKQRAVGEKMTLAKIEHPKKFSEEVKEKVDNLGVKDLPDKELITIADNIAKGDIDKDVLEKQGLAQTKLQEVLKRFRALIDERVALADGALGENDFGEEVETATDDAGGEEGAEEEKRIYTPEEVARELLPEAVKKSLAESDRLDENIKEAMIKNIPEEFPEKYRLLVGAYYKTLIEKREE